MATVQELTQAVNALVAATQPLAGAINSLEAAVTAAKNSGTLSAADQAALDAAFAQVQTVTGDITAAITDANDGVDEAAGAVEPK